MKRTAIFLALAVGAPAKSAEATSNTAEARIALEAYGICVAARSPRESARVLAKDFTTTDYRSGLRLLATSMAKDCAKDTFGVGALRGNKLLFAGAIAEGLLENNREPVNVRLTRAVHTPAPTYAATDAVAQCLARSLPEQVGALFAAAPGSGSEAAAAAPLMSRIPACAPGTPVELTVPALRAAIATAAFRLIAESEKSAV